MLSTAPFQSFESMRSRTLLQNDPFLNEPETAAVAASFSIQPVSDKPTKPPLFTVFSSASTVSIHASASISAMDRSTIETPRHEAANFEARCGTDSYVVTVQVRPPPKQYRAFKTLREEIDYYDAQRRARWAKAAEDTTTTSSTSEAEAETETESAGEEASCSSLVDMPHQTATTCDEDRQGEDKPMGTPLWEPIVREDGTVFHPILELFACREKFLAESGEDEAVVVALSRAGKRRRSEEDVIEHNKVVKTS